MTAWRERSQSPEEVGRAGRRGPGKKRARADSNAHPVSAMRKNSPLRSAKGRTAVAAAAPPVKADLLWLNDYLPYRMAVVAARMLREAGRVYKRRRDPLNTPQWRVLGILANHEPLTASEISKISMLDKVAISRTLVEMVRRGFAWAFVKYSSAYVAEEAEARTRGVGIWQAPTTTAWDHRAGRWAEARDTESGNGASGTPSRDCVIKGNITSGGRIYHMPWSPWYEKVRIEAAKGERWFCNENEAVAAGWRPVRVN